MTLASCDIHVAEPAALPHRAGPGKDIYIMAVAARKFAAPKPRPPAASLPRHLLGVREDLAQGASYCSATGGFACNIAGRERGVSGMREPSNRLRRPGG